MIKELVEYGINYLFSIPGITQVIVISILFALIEIGVCVWTVMNGICMRRIRIIISLYILYLMIMILLAIIY